VERAFEAVTRLYPPKTAQGIFKRRSPLAERLAHPISLWASDLFRMALDAADAEPWASKALLKSLADPDQFDGAPFELRV
jgi:hypothetical protein